MVALTKAIDSLWKSKSRCGSLHLMSITASETAFVLSPLATLFYHLLTVLSAISSWNLTSQCLQVDLLPNSLSFNCSSWVTFAPVMSESKDSVFLLRWDKGLFTNLWVIGLEEIDDSHSLFLVLIPISWVWMKIEGWGWEQKMMSIKTFRKQTLSPKNKTSLISAPFDFSCPHLHYLFNSLFEWVFN